ncbi:MAG: ribosome biogenesis GTP-binding protein YihA/YsxC [Bacteroidia bacterium]
MIVKSAEFVISNTQVEGCPKPTLPEYAFIGRSNVGKSSLINRITQRMKLAKTSGKPGKTQLINHFIINKDWYLVDLPGYGYAKASKDQRKEFHRLISDYISGRTNLMNLFVLVDIRLEPQKADKEFFQWLGENAVPFVIAFTKCDKLTTNQIQSNLAAYKKYLKQDWEELPQIFLSSAETGFGSEEILAFIEKTNALFDKPF